MKKDKKNPWDTNIEWLMFFDGVATGILIASIIYAIANAILK